MTDLLSIAEGTITHYREERHTHRGHLTGGRTAEVSIRTDYGELVAPIPVTPELVQAMLDRVVVVLSLSVKK